jgi:hypothetical protein
MQLPFSVHQQIKAHQGRRFSAANLRMRDWAGGSAQGQVDDRLSRHAYSAIVKTGSARCVWL